MRRTALALLAIALLASCSRTHTRESFPDAPVILISIDTLRADRLPAYGYREVETPAIDAFRRDSILYANAYSQAPLTLPSHVSLLTGLLPYEHGVRDNLGYSYDAARDPSIAQLLKKKGYATGAAVSAYVLRGSTGFGRAFDFYDDAVPPAANVSIADLSRRGDATAAVAEPWIDSHAGTPFFFLFHIYEPHAPYEPAAEMAGRYRNPYDGEVVTADAIVGRFIERLKSAGVYDRAIVILLSDHGEGLGDHGEDEHGVFLYRETLRVPLMVKLPGAERHGETVERPVGLIDIAPTIASLTGVAHESRWRGTSLLETSKQERQIYSETMFPRIHFGWSELRSIVDARHHFIAAPKPELYDVQRDPGEKTNVLDSERRVYAEMNRALSAHPSSLRAPSAVDPEEAKRLSALGYIGQVRDTAAGELPDPKDRIGDLAALRKGSELERLGHLAEAERAYRAAAVVSPKFADAWIRLAIVEEQLGAGDSAEQAYRSAISASPSLAPDLALPMASIYLRMGRLDEARAHAEVALTRAPLAAHHLLGRIALARGDAATAEREAGVVLADRAYRGSGAVLLAQIRTRQGRFAEALATLEAIPEPERAQVVDFEGTRGDVLARMDRSAEAEAAFRKEIARFPRNRDVYPRLALLLFSEGRRAEADAVLQQFTRAMPSPETRAIAAETRRVVGEIRR